MAYSVRGRVAVVVPSAPWSHAVSAQDLEGFFNFVPLVLVLCSSIPLVVFFDQLCPSSATVITRAHSTTTRHI
jgi:hypothetical protein